MNKETFIKTLNSLIKTSESIDRLSELIGVESGLMENIIKTLEEMVALFVDMADMEFLDKDFVDWFLYECREKPGTVYIKEEEILLSTAEDMWGFVERYQAL